MSSIFTDLLQRYASRKFLIPVGFGALLYYNAVQDLGIPPYGFALLAVLCFAFIWKEGEADVVERGKIEA